MKAHRFRQEPTHPFLKPSPYAAYCGYIDLDAQLVCCQLRDHVNHIVTQEAHDDPRAA